MKSSRKTSIGIVCIEEENGKIVSVEFGSKCVEGTPSPLIDTAFVQIDSYLKGDLKKFDLPIELKGTAFQKKVWKELLKIPYGETASYGEIAKRAGVPLGARAVGLACNRNPVVLVVPCHRVVGKNGSLVGFGGGLDVKKTLLDLERAK